MHTTKHRLTLENKIDSHNPHLAKSSTLFARGHDSKTKCIIIIIDFMLAPWLSRF